MSDRFDSTRLETAGGIKYTQYEGFPTIEWNEDEATAVEVYLMKSTDVIGFINEVAPLPYVDEEGTIYLPTRRRMPGTNFMISRSVSAEPFGGKKPGDPFGVDSDAPNDTYDDTYKLTINYSTMKNSADDDQVRDPKDPRTFLERTVDGGGEFLAVGPQNTTTGDKDLGIDQNPEAQDATDGQSFGSNYPNAMAITNEEATADPNLPIVKFIPTAEFSFKWPLVIVPPWRTMFGYLGTVNGSIRKSSGAIDEVQRAIHRRLFFNLENETVLYKGFSATQKFIWNGSSAAAQPWEVRLQFSMKRVEELKKIYAWNHVWVPKTQKWQRVFRKGPMGEKLDLYKMRNHLNLFLAGNEDDRRAS